MTEPAEIAIDMTCVARVRRRSVRLHVRLSAADGRLDTRSGSLDG